MSGTKEELTRSWLTKAGRDLLSARELADGRVPLLDTAAYHCQQTAARLLTPLAVEFRYPGDYIEPEQEEFRDAYDAAQALYAFVIEKLPLETHPSVQE